MLLIYTKSALLLLILCYRKNQVNSFSNDETNANSHDIKVYTLSDNKKVENDSTKYDLKHVKENVHKYLFKQDSKCVEFKFEGESVWKYDQNKSTEGYPVKIDVFIYTKTVFVCFKNDIMYVYRKTDDKWDSLFSGEVGPIDVDVKNKESDEFVDFNKDKRTKLVTYIPKPGFLFNNAKRSKSTPCCCGNCYDIWDAEDYTEYANKVVGDTSGCCNKTDNVTIYLLNGYVKHYNKPGCYRLWLELPVETQLDIKKKKSSYQFSYSKNGKKKIGTYTTNFNFLFNSVIDSTRSGSESSKVEIWAAKDPGEFANKVEIDGTGSSIIVTIKFVNGETKKFEKSGSNLREVEGKSGLK